MKRLTVFIMIAALLAALLLLGGCSLLDLVGGLDESPSSSQSPSASESDTTAASPSASDSTASPSASDSTASPSASDSSAPPSAVVSPSAPHTYTDVTYNNGGISIKYPELTGMVDLAAQSALNQFISDAALNGTDGIDPSETDYEIVDTVTLNTADVFCVIFDGYSSTQGAAHPYTFLHTLILDAANKQSVRLNDLVKVDADFVEMLKNAEYTSMSYDITPGIRQDIIDYLDSSGTEGWLTMLAYADTDGAETQSFLTTDSLVVSVGVPYALGGHVEIVLPYTQLGTQMTNHDVWTALGL